MVVVVVVLMVLVPEGEVFVAGVVQSRGCALIPLVYNTSTWLSVKWSYLNVVHCGQREQVVYVA